MGKHETTILIIDDMRINLLILEKLLVSEGYKVLTADNGPEGREIATKVIPDLILLDYYMPGEDGFEVISKLKDNAHTSHISILFITASDDMDIKIKAFNHGAVDYIIKPFHSSEILARVRVHARLNRAMKAVIENQTAKMRQIQHAQDSMLIKPTEIPEANFGIHFASIQEAGGDFYDVLPIAKGTFGYFVADVSGHDIETSYITAAIKALLNQNCNNFTHPSESMQIINKVLSEILKNGKYLTACYLELNRLKHEVNIINMGHPPIICQPKNGETKLIELSGDILGAFPDVIFGHDKFNVKDGDRFYLYSDGLIESSTASKVWTSMTKHLLKEVESVRDIPVDRAGKALKEMLFTDSEREIEDDIVVLVVEV